MAELAAALDDGRERVERELAQAETDLEALQARERELVTLIARARAFLRRSEPDLDRSQAGHVPLHAEMVRILRENGNRVMTGPEIMAAVNRAGNYRTRDGGPISVGQVHARVHNYSHLFARERGGIRLADGDSSSRLAPDDPTGLDRLMFAVYDDAMREVGYPARRFLHMVRERGGLETARGLLAKPGVSEGFRRLADADKLHLTMEYRILGAEFRPHFTERELEEARRRLRALGMSESLLPG